MKRLSTLCAGLIIICGMNSLSAEFIFLKDGSITEGKVLSETDKQMRVNIDGKPTVIDRVKILRVRFDADFKKLVYLKKTDGKTVEGYIVEEDGVYYTIRDRLESPAEFKVERKEIVAVSSEKYVSKGTYYAFGVIPGGSQFYVKKDLKGTIFLTSSIAAYGFTGWAYYTTKKKHDDYKKLEKGLSQSTYDSKYNDYKKANTMFIAGIVTSGLIYLAHWTDVIFFSAPDFSTKSSEPQKAFLDFRFDRPIVTSYSSMKDAPIYLGMGMTF